MAEDLACKHGDTWHKTDGVRDLKTVGRLAVKTKCGLVTGSGVHQEPLDANPVLCKACYGGAS